MGLTAAGNGNNRYDCEGNGNEQLGTAWSGIDKNIPAHL